MNSNVIHLQSDSSVYGPLVAWFKSVSDSVSSWSQKRRAKADLRDLPDYLLADIGIARSQIESFVEGRDTFSVDESSEAKIAPRAIQTTELVA
ncbi:MAG: hypothetical protein ACI8P9_005667 [Parasphingorhabdus sp.]|jgi:uncharacterized protein YjiS (DUF1127 family)